MALHRREFLGLLLGSGVYASTAGATEELDSWLFSQSDKSGVSILQGMTDDTSAQFSVVLPEGKWSFEAVRKDGGNGPRVVNLQVVKRPYSPYAVHKFMVEGLERDTDYLLRVLDGHSLKDERDFRALNTDARKVRIALVSCQLDLLHRDDIWQQFDRRDPELVLFLGDNVYADRTSFISKTPADEKQLWERYVITRNRVAFYFQRRLRPVIATWDDHDFGADNAGSQYPYKEQSRVIFETFFAQAPRPTLLSGPGVAKRFSAFGADFFMLDDRTYRVGSDEGGTSMLGEAQMRWLVENSRARATWLINGSVFYGAYNSLDSYEGSFAGEWGNLRSRLAKTESLYCFASGDVHYSEMMEIEKEQLGYPTFEIVSSSIHSYTFPGHENRFSNPRRRAATSAHNFVIFEGNFSPRAINGELISYSATREEFREAVRAVR